MPDVWLATASSLHMASFSTWPRRKDLQAPHLPRRDMYCNRISFVSWKVQGVIQYVLYKFPKSFAEIACSGTPIRIQSNDIRRGPVGIPWLDGASLRQEGRRVEWGPWNELNQRLFKVEWNVTPPRLVTSLKILVKSLKTFAYYHLAIQCNSCFPFVLILFGPLFGGHKGLTVFSAVAGRHQWYLCKKKSRPKNETHISWVNHQPNHVTHFLEVIIEHRQSNIKCEGFIPFPQFFQHGVFVPSWKLLSCQRQRTAKCRCRHLGESACQRAPRQEVWTFCKPFWFGHIWA